MAETPGLDAIAAGFRAEMGPPVEELNALHLPPERMPVTDLLWSVEFLRAEVKRRLPIEDVERFLKRERDEHGKESYWWRSLDEALDAFRLHMVTGTPLTEPRPEGGPEALGVGPEPLTEAEELRAEVERLTAALVESRRGEHYALARADKAETERDKLRAELDTAKAVMYRALKSGVEHEEVVYLLRQYLDVYPGTTAAFPATTGEDA